MEDRSFRGVTERDGKWEARITFNGRRVSLGLFDKAEEAAKAYDLRAYRDPRIGHSLNLPEVDYSALPDEMARPSDLTAQLEEIERAIYDAETAHLSDEWGNILAGWKTLEDSSW